MLLLNKSRRDLSNKSIRLKTRNEFHLSNGKKESWRSNAWSFMINDDLVIAAPCNEQSAFQLTLTSNDTRSQNAFIIESPFERIDLFPSRSNLQSQSCGPNDRSIFKTTFVVNKSLISPNRLPKNAIQGQPLGGSLPSWQRHDRGSRRSHGSQ